MVRERNRGEIKCVDNHFLKAELNVALRCLLLVSLFSHKIQRLALSAHAPHTYPESESKI